MEAERAYESFGILDQEIGTGRVKGTGSVGKKEEDLLLNDVQALGLEGHKKNAVEWPDVKLEMKESPKHDTSPVSAAPEFKMKLPFAKGNEQPEIPPQENSGSIKPTGN